MYRENLTKWSTEAEIRRDQTGHAGKLESPHKEKLFPQCKESGPRAADPENEAPAVTAVEILWQ